jgi:antitoxin PrlF
MSARIDLEAGSTLTDRYQTTVPEAVRRVLKLGKRDRIHYTIRPGGEVVLRRASIESEEDPALGKFLSFLAADLETHPERIKAMDTNLRARLQRLIGDINVDLEQALQDDDE